MEQANSNGNLNSQKTNKTIRSRSFSSSPSFSSYQTIENESRSRRIVRVISGEEVTDEVHPKALPERVRNLQKSQSYSSK